MRGIARITMGIIVTGALGVSAAAAQQAPQAPEGPRLGTQMAYQFDVRDPAVGAQLDVPVAPRFALYPSGAIYLVDTGSLWGVNADVKYHLASPVYLGGGLNLLRRSVADNGHTDAGVNLLGGVEGRLGRHLYPFAEGRVIINDGSAFLLGAGLSIPLSSGHRR
jgi:hypothetical protein